jgi:hypothetical protein
VACKQRDFIQRLRRLGFEGPYPGTRHQFMVFQQCRLAIPANTEYSVPQLRLMVEEVEAIIKRKITATKWGGL